MTKRGKAYATGGAIAAILALIGIGIASASDKPTPGGGDDDDDGCPEGFKRNPMYAEAQARVRRSGLRGAQLGIALAQIPICVHKVCPEGYTRNEATGACEPDDGPKFNPDPGTDGPDTPTACRARGGVWDPVSKTCNEKCPDGQHFSLTLGRCVDDPVTCPPGQHYDASQGRCVDDESPTDIEDIITVVPRPGYFYQVRQKDIFFGKKSSNGQTANGLSICYMALKRAAHDAAMAHGGLDDAAAWAYVDARTNFIGHEGDSLRPYLAVIGCGWWNDAAYASWRYAAGKATPNPTTGRAISLNPAHAPNRSLLATGSAAARNVRLGVPADKGDGSPTIARADWRSYPLLWIPEIDLELYWSSGFETITAEGLTWGDGSSRAVPPPWVSDRGIDDASGTLHAGTVMGCGPSTQEIG